MPPRPLHPLCGQCDVRQSKGNCTFHQGPSTPVHGYRLYSNNPGFIMKTIFLQSVAFTIARIWYHCRHSRRCSGGKRRARKGRLDFRFAFARRLEIVFVTTATPTSAFIVEQVTVGSTNACHTILRSSLLVVFLVAPDPVFCAWVPSRVHSSQHFLRHTTNDLPGQPHGALTSLQFSC